MNSLITMTGRKKMAEARAGIKPVSPITQIAVGDGGLEEDGTLKSPGETLYHEVLRRDVESIMKVSDTCYRYKLQMNDDELPKCAISEAVLIDSDGDVVASITFEKKVKDEGAKMFFEMDDNF